ncbi:MAG TPA: hypothetical protein HPP94_14705 [Desulfuromonadales bacterium]|nr:hypothetical protein [Desulfuromonadales bacterium]
MARLKPPALPAPEQMPRCGVDTLYFTTKGKVHNTLELLEWLKQYIASDITEEHITVQMGNGLYKQCISISAEVENPKELLPPYKGMTTELLRIYFDPRPQGNKLYDNQTTAFQLKGELLKRIDYLPILEFIRANNASVTALHLFKDDFDYVLNMNLINHLCSISAYTDHLQSPLVRSYLDILNGENSVYLNPKGKKQVHFYDKSLQLGTKFQHIRCEVKLSKDNKFLTGLVTALADGTSMEQLISSVISKYISFKPAGNGRINDRKPCEWWSKFLESTTSVKRSDFIPALSVKRLKTCQQLLAEKERLQGTLQLLEEQLKSHPDYVEF